MARKPAPAPERKDTGVSDALILNDFSAANELAVVQREAEARTRAVAQQLGYQLPADCADPDLIQRDIAANMRRSVEAVLQVGIGLCVLKEACQHGQFLPRLEALGVDLTLAKRLMQAASKFSNGAAPHLLKSAGNQSKLLELLVLDDEQIAELEEFGQTGELALDDVASMSQKELRAALRELRAEKSAGDELLDKKQARIDKLERDVQRIKRQPPAEALLGLQKEATTLTNEARGCVRGNLRQALLALAAHGEAQSENHCVFMAGLVGQVQADLAALREEFSLPDVSRAADAELAAEVAQWAKN